MHTYIYMQIIYSEAFKDKLKTEYFFTNQFHSIFSKSEDILLYNHNADIKISKFYSDAIPLSSS